MHKFTHGNLFGILISQSLILTSLNYLNAYMSITGYFGKKKKKKKKGQKRRSLKTR